MRRTEIFILREGKIRLIHKITQYEKSAGEYEHPAEEYFRDDYLSMHLLQSFFSYTLSYLLIPGAFPLYFLERILNAASVSIVLRLVLCCVVVYTMSLLLFELVTHFAFRRRYEEPAAQCEEHLRCLKRLKKHYDTEEKIRELEKEESANA